MPDATLYQNQWKRVWNAEGPDSLRERTLQLLRTARREIDDPSTPAATMNNRIGLLLELGGEPEDIKRLERLQARLEASHDPQDRMARTLVENACEARRQMQERAYMLSDIDEEEERLLLEEGPPAPNDPASKWVAVRRGRRVAEGPDRASVERKVRRHQEGKPGYFAVIVEVGKPLRVWPHR